MRGKLAVVALMLTAALGTGAIAQHAQHGTQQQDGATTSTLSAEAIRQLLDGDGMGLARAADLNGYPGPKHVLDLKDALGISTEQASKVEAIRQQMLKAARQLGTSIVEAERALDSAFMSGRITEEDLDRRTAAIAELQGRLRKTHLHAHLLTKAVMTTDQVARYAELRRAHH